MREQPATADQVLNVGCEFDHVHMVRSVGPAIVLVLEHEGPMRMETSYSTEPEFAALRAGLSRSASKVLTAYFAAKADEEGIAVPGLWLREDNHAARLEAGKRISTLRIDGDELRIRTFIEQIGGTL